MEKRVKLALAMLVTVLLAYFLFTRRDAVRGSVAHRDSIAYWAAGRLLIHHVNPYDRSAVLQLERDNGYEEARPLILRTPPWSLLLVLPLGLVTPLWAFVLWISGTLAALLAGMRFCRDLYGSSVPHNLLIVAGYLFAPIAACLISGQMGLILMFGVVLFLYWQANRPFMAGGALVLPFAKPHLLMLFWVVVLLWAISGKKRAVIVGFVSAFSLATVVALALDPHIFQHYREMLRTASIQHEFIPALSGIIRLIFFRQRFWTQFMPMAIGVLWGLRFFLQNRTGWNWPEHGPLLLVISVLTTPYAWLGDETVLLPAVLQATAFLYRARAKMNFFNRIAVLLLVLLNLLLLLILKARIPFATGIYFWSSVVWFLWYLHAYRLRAKASRRTLESMPQAIS